MFMCVSVGSLTVKLLAGPGKVNNYFWGGYLHPTNKNSPWQKNCNPPPFNQKKYRFNNLSNDFLNLLKCLDICFLLQSLLYEA